MATLALGILGAGLGALAGDPMLGWQVGTVIGGAIEAGQARKKAELGRLNDLRVTHSTYGAPIPLVWGSFRLGGNMIWSLDSLNESSHRQGKKGPRVYSYSDSFAIAWCAGPLTRINKIWAEDRIVYDATAIPSSGYTLRNYLGDETQIADTLIVANAGALTPAFRGLAYTVFDAFPLADWGNHVPNLSAEVVKSDSAAFLASDAFNRPDGALGTADSGQTWQFGTTQGQVVSNRANSTGTPGFAQWVETGQSDVAVQLTIGAVDASLGTGHVIARLTDENNCWRWGSRGGFGTGNYELRKAVAGVGTSVVSTSIPQQAGDVLKIVCNGPDIYGYVNGTQQAHVTDSFNQTATKHGFSSPAPCPIDDWSASPVVGPTSTHVSTILADIFQLVGLAPSQYDVTAATDVVEGFVLTDRQDAHSAIDSLLTAYDTMLVEVDGKIVAVKRGAAPVLSIPASDLAARVDQGGGEPPPAFTAPISSALDAPNRVEVHYYSEPFRNYLDAMQGATRATKTWQQNPHDVRLPLVLSDTAGRQLAEKLLYRMSLEREQPAFSLPPRYLKLAPGDVVTLPVPGGTQNVRLTQIDVALPGPLQCTAVLDDAAVLTQSVAGGTTITPSAELTSTIAATLVAWSGNALTNTDADTVGIYVAAGVPSGSYWPGGILYWSRDAGASYQELDRLSDSALVGTALTALPAFTQTGKWDDLNTLDISVAGGSAPLSTSDADVLSGANILLVGDEVIQYGVVTPLTATSYRLSHLLRGQRGTDGRWDTHVTGERIVGIDSGSVHRLALGFDLRGRSILVKLVGNGQAIAGVSPVSVYVSGEEFKPYMPVLITGTRDGSNNLTAAWYRRDRKFVGLQDAVDEPMSETVEQYYLDVLSGAQKTITGITLATNAVVTSTLHGFLVGQAVRISGVAGMSPINHLIATVTAVTTNSFTTDVNTSTMPQYISGGSAERVLRTLTSSTPTVVYSAANQITDWGSTQPSVRVAISQIGRYGRGFQGVAAI